MEMSYDWLGRLAVDNPYLEFGQRRHFWGRSR
jgi:hypothetical protein